MVESCWNIIEVVTHDDMPTSEQFLKASGFYR